MSTSSPSSNTSQAPTTVAGDTRQYLTFALGHELFAVPIANVCEVIELAAITEIPLAPPVVPGVINLRGSVVPVVELGRRLGRSEIQLGRRTCIIVVEVAFEEGILPLGVLVDSVREAIEVEAPLMQASPAFASGLRTDFVAGMINLAGNFVLVLDLAVVLSVGELELLVSSASAVSATGAH